MTGSAAAIPLAGWADAQLALLTARSGVAMPSGTALMAERAKLNGFAIPGRVSPGGGCRFYDTSDGALALNLSRPDDRELLPALFGDAGLAVNDDDALAARFRHAKSTAIVAQGRLLGMAIASIDEQALSPAVAMTALTRAPAPSRHPVVLDMSALWAGPLAGRLLALTGARTIKIESRHRPDAMREGDPRLFSRLNDDKTQRTIDFRSDVGLAELRLLLDRADIVIEAARPRAMLQLGIDTDAMVRDRPGQVWVTVTGHGIMGEAANWVGFGDDAAVTGGLSAALRDATGQIGFAGDATADPVAGIAAARLAYEHWTSGKGARIIVAMSAMVAEAVAWEKSRHAAGFDAMLRAWSRSVGQPFPC